MSEATPKRRRPAQPFEVRLHDDAMAWMQEAQSHVDDIGGWRDAEPDDREKRFWRGAAPIRRGELRPRNPYKFDPADFEQQTLRLMAYIFDRPGPKLDPTPVHEIWLAISNWYEDHDARRIEPQGHLENTLERAVLVVGAVLGDMSKCLSRTTEQRTNQREGVHSEDPEGNTDPKASGRAFLVSELYDMVNVSGATMNRYARAAGVDPPGVGEQNHRFTEDEARTILSHGSGHARSRRTREAFQDALKRFNEIKE